MEDRFSRAAFEASADPASLARLLESLLEKRLRAAHDAARQSHEVIDELRALGHDLWSFDESDQASVWSGDYVRKPHATRLELRFAYPSNGEIEVEVVYGPWPVDAPKSLCPRCAIPMEPSHVLVRLTGHGQVGAPDIRAVIHFGEWPPVELVAGIRSLHVQVTGFTCHGCKGIWLPDSTRLSAA